MNFEIVPDKLFQINIKSSGETIQISNGSGDHAVRYPRDLGWLDHLVIFSPVGIPFENEDTGETEVMRLLRMDRYFLGATAVETIVSVAGLHEVYANEVTECVHEDYLEQQANNLEGMFDE